MDRRGVGVVWGWGGRGFVERRVWAKGSVFGVARGLVWVLPSIEGVTHLLEDGLRGRRPVVSKTSCVYCSACVGGQKR